MTPSRPVLGLALGVIGVVIFGATLPMTRIAVQALDPWFVTFGRAALAGAIALTVMALLRRRPPPAAEWPLYATAAFCLVVGFPGLMALAMVTVPAGYGGVVLGALPLATAMAGVFFAGERPSAGFWAAGAVGAGLVVAFTLTRTSGGFNPMPGAIYLAASVVAAAVGYAASAVLSKDRPGWEMVSWMLILALPVSAPLALFTAPADLAAVPRLAGLAFLYLALFSQYIGFFFWNAGLAMGGIARVSQTQLLQTFVTLAIAAAIVGETIGADVILFAVAVVATVVLGSRLRAR